MFLIIDNIHIYIYLYNFEIDENVCSFYFIIILENYFLQYSEN